jgi:hypothetical protein
MRDYFLTSEAPVVNPPGPAVPGPPEQPTITGFQAPEFCDNNRIAIYGSGFGPSLATGYVSVTVPFVDAQGKPFTQEFVMPVLLWSENAIHALLILPPGAQLGAYTLTVHRTTGKSASRSFPVVACP